MHASCWVLGLAAFTLASPAVESAKFHVSPSGNEADPGSPAKARVEYNVVRNVVTETDDAGTLYKGRNPSCRGNVIRCHL